MSRSRAQTPKRCSVLPVREDWLVGGAAPRRSFRHEVPCVNLQNGMGSSRQHAGAAPDIHARSIGESAPDWRSAHPVVCEKQTPTDSALRCDPAAEAAVLLHWRWSTWAFYLGGVAMPIAAVLGLWMPQRRGTPFFGFLPFLVAVLVAGLGTAERAVCRCPRCRVTLRHTFRAWHPECPVCAFPAREPSQSMMAADSVAERRANR